MKGHTRPADIPPGFLAGVHARAAARRNVITPDLAQLILAAVEPRPPVDTPTTRQFLNGWNHAATEPGSR